MKSVFIDGDLVEATNKESVMKRNMTGWQVMLALVIAAIIPLLISGCSNKDEAEAPAEKAEAAASAEAAAPAAEEGSSEKTAE